MPENPRTPGTKYRSPSGEIKTYGYPSGEPFDSGDGGGVGSSQAVQEFIKRDSVSGFVSKREGMENEALANLISKMQGQESLESIYGRLSGEENIAQLQATAGGFRGSLARTQELLEQLEPNITERITPFEVTEAQRSRMLASEQTPLVRQIGTLARSLGVSVEDLNVALGNVGRRMGFAVSQQERELEPLKLKLQTISDQSARAITGFTADRQSQLDFLMDRMNRQEDLNDRDWQLATQLANEEKIYKRERQDSLDDMYLQYGLDPDSGRLSPLGEYLKGQGDLEHQRSLQLKRTGVSGGGGGQPASAKEFEYLLSKGFSREEASAAAFGIGDKGNQTESEYKRGVATTVNQMYDAGDTPEMIDNYLYQEGLDPADYSYIYEEEEEAGKWWNPFD